MSEPEASRPSVSVPEEPHGGITALRTREQVLVDAVRVLTEAVRVSCTHTDADGTTRGGRLDWAEFVARVLAGAAANVGGVEAVLAGRPGSWEADYVRRLLAGTLGPAGEHLFEHRTEPVVVDLYVDEIMVDLGVWSGYDAAASELAGRYDALVPPTGTPGAAIALTAEQQRQADAIADLEERLEQLRRQDWTAYGEALRANVEAAAARREGLRVPVVVNVDVETFRDRDQVQADFAVDGLAEQLRSEAIEVTALPGNGRPPLQRLENTGADRLEGEDGGV